MDFREFLRQGFVVLDGATGSNLQQAGMESGDCPEQWIAKHPEVFIDLQCRYIEAGSDVLYTPTFTCNRIKNLRKHWWVSQKKQFAEVKQTAKFMLPGIFP